MHGILSHRSHYALDGVNFFVAAMQTGFGVFVTVYLVQNGWGAEAIGFALTLSTVSSLVSQLPTGALIDHLADKRRAVQAGVAGVGAAALLLALSAARPGVYLAQVLQGLTSSLIAPGIAAISLAAVGHAGLCERIGRNARFASIGSGLTAGVMGIAGSYFEPVAIFWLTAALALPTLLFVSRVDHPRTAEITLAGSELDEGRPSWDGLKGLILDRRLLVFALCIVLFFAASAAMLPGVAARVTKRYADFAPLIVAGTMLLPQAVVAGISPWVGRTAEHVGRRPLLLLGWGLVPLQGVLYATLPGAYALPICLVLNGISGAVFGVMMTVVAADLTRGTGRFNLTLGALGVAISIGASLSTLLGGLTAATLGGAAAFLFLALLGLLGAVLLWIGLPETKLVASDSAGT
ncbi:MAG: MFS transporter [Alphaproteobacteria bacterium]|nr:MFS transporter [Alphaproteobacteria bacterium]